LLANPITVLTQAQCSGVIRAAFDRGSSFRFW
jgi:hypothetical protein